MTADLEALDATLTDRREGPRPRGAPSADRRTGNAGVRPELWNDQDHAQKVTSALSHAQAEMRRVTELRQRLDDLPVHYELADAEGATIVRRPWPTPTPSVNRCAATSRRWKSRRCWPAIRPARRPGEHPLRCRWRRRRGLGADADAHVHPLGRGTRIRRRGVRHLLHAEEAGIRAPPSPSRRALHARARCRWSRAPPTGRISPFDNQGRRQTSFAEVEILPVVEVHRPHRRRRNDIKVDVYRSSGPGGAVGEHD